MRLFYVFGGTYLIYTLYGSFPILFTCVAIFVVARKRMLKRNEVHSNSDQDSRGNLMVFLRQLNMAWWFSAVFVGTTILNKEEIGC